LRGLEFKPKYIKKKIEKERKRERERERISFMILYLIYIVEDEKTLWIHFPSSAPHWRLKER
jgi:hypothetical protein